MKNKNIGLLTLAFLALLAIVGVFFLEPISQDENYHNFCDSKTLFSIPNFWNVISNLPFLIVGVYGMMKRDVFGKKSIQYILFFVGISLVSLGSGYYHLNPNNTTLIWDRLPMTIAFMSLFSIIVSEFIDYKIGLKLLFPALIIGILSVIYWLIFNDLRVYVLVQFYPILAILVILLFFKSSYTLTYGYWLLLLAYILAKGFEHFDHQIQDISTFMSGHPLKHLAAAIGIFALLYTYIRREKVN